ncbi:TonB-dependent receptor domain-containing protein [Silvibacterium sp.]|uniref:TonB-dependent receptor domain-containing protein n=1 Tax=Silvibacterium sp. TaxID=1964179 RepID=UPI0039E25C3C
MMRSQKPHLRQVASRLICILIAGLGLVTPFAVAQTGGQGAVEGTVTDPQGALVPNATVTATNQATNVSTSIKSSSAGVYEITPLIPGVYTLSVSASGFKDLKQQNIEVNGLTITGYNAVLTLGEQSQTVTVTEAPPQLQTTNATLGGVITNKTYESLPVLMSNAQRDPTAYATLLPGATPGARAPIMSGTGSYLSEVYLDGIPTTLSNQQSDNRTISLSVPVESVDQMQVISNGPSAEYQGAGAISFTSKSGGNKYHGTIADFVRNTMFDTWGFTAPYATTTKLVDGVSTTVPAGKPVEHQNELSASIGGPIKFTHDRGFFFFNWDQYHGREGVQPTLMTVPTTLMRQGNFTELGSDPYIYNPLTSSCSGSTCSRQVFAYNGQTNVIDPSYISSISQYEQSFLPAPSLSGISNNYLASGVSGFDNHEFAFKIDYDLTSKQRYSFVATHGVEQYVGYGAELPVPYTTGEDAVVSATNLIFEHQYTLTSQMVNQFKYGFTRFITVKHAPTETGNYASDAGITGLPAGQASNNFPCSDFGTTTAFPTAITEWTDCGSADASGFTTANSYTLVDNLQWSKGKHAITFGAQLQWLQDNVAQQSSASGVYVQNWNGLDTSNYVGTSLSDTATGYSYASFLLGAVHSASTSVPSFSDQGGRYLPISPYVQDDWKVKPNLTLSLGLRWDYLPPYREVQDRWSYFNPDGNSGIDGTQGALEFAGYHGSDISCDCRTPVHTYWKNWGPRLGLAWSVTRKTVIRAGYSTSYTHGGGVGGRSYAGTGPSTLGYGADIVLPSAVTTGADAAPSFYLNDSAAFTAAGKANTNFGGPGYSIPAPQTPSSSSLDLNVGNYVSSAGKYVTAGAAPLYVDPYLSGRAPEFNFFNFGVQHALTDDLTIMVNYAGSQSHFLTGATVSGFWSGEMDPVHLARLGSVLASDNATNIMNAPATAANIAIAEAADPSISIPSWYAAAGALSTVPTIGHALLPYPQYSSSPTPAWDNISNVSYNSLQISLTQREWKGLSYTLNYTYSKNIGDDGTTRSAFAVPAAASSNGAALPGKNRADRGLTLTDVPQDLDLYGLYNLPFGKGHLGGDNPLLRTLIGGWSFSGVFIYISGNPIPVIATGCTTPDSGTCMPDSVSGVKIRKSGSWGKGVYGNNLGAVKYLNSAAFQLPNAFALPAGASSKAVAITKIGDAPRTGLNLWSPSVYNINASIRRSFNLTKSERVKFIFQVDCSDCTNKVTFGGISSTWSAATSSTFGEVTSASGNRDFQFSGRVNF